MWCGLIAGWKSLHIYEIKLGKPQENMQNQKSEVQSEFFSNKSNVATNILAL